MDSPQLARRTCDFMADKPSQWLRVEHFRRAESPWPATAGFRPLIEGLFVLEQSRGRLQ